jgi:hypothetical protein
VPLPFCNAGSDPHRAIAAPEAAERTIKISRNKIAAVMANLQVFAMLNQTAADSGIWRLL